MVIYYNKETREIQYTERDVITPELIEGDTSEKIEELDKENISFVSVPYEVDLEIFSYKVCLDEEGNFLGLQPKEELS